MPTLPNLSGYSPHLTAGSVLDILLVSFLIYQFLLLVRGTRAVPMLTGVGALVIAFYIAHLSNLSRTQSHAHPGLAERRRGRLR